jgi:CRISPR/Cas system-associated exonuclease Cas4 (RecB family)
MRRRSKMAKLNKLSKMIKTAKKNSVAEDFRADLEYCIEQENKREYIPSKSFKPSGISGCKRSLFYELTGIRPDEEPPNVNLTGICESGTDRHETIQYYVMKMRKHNIDCEWVDVGQYVKDNNIPHTEIVSQNGNETKLYNKAYNLRFLCDGLIKYKGEYYILEIKTESSNKFNMHTEPWPEHILQASCYSLVLQVPKVIFLYENRDICSKKAMLVNVTSEMKEHIRNIIWQVERYIDDDIIPPKEPDKCKYCKYQSQCRKDGE